MKKVIPLILLLLLATWLGATYLISDQVEKNYANAVKQVNQKLKSDFPFITLEPETFDKGFLSSEATSRISGIGDSSEGIGLRHKIYHGPVMFTPAGVKTGSSYIVTTIDLDTFPEEVRQTIRKASDTDNPLTISLLTGTSETFDVDIELAPLQFRESGNNAPEITFDGLTGSVQTDVDGSFLTGGFHSGKLTIEDEQGAKLSLAPGEGVFDITDMYNGTVLSGTSRATLPEASISAPGVESRLQGLSISSENNTRGDTLTSKLAISVEKLQLEVPASHIQLPDSTIQLQTEISGIETTALKQLLDTQQELNALQMNSVASSFSNKASPVLDEEAMGKTLQRYMQSLVNLVKPGLQSTTRFMLKNEAGIADLHLDLGYAESRDLSQLPTIRDLIGAVKGELEIKADEKLLSTLSLDALAAMPVAMGFATQENGQLQSLIRLEKGDLNVNGGPLPLMNMLGPVLNQPSPIPALLAN